MLIQAALVLLLAKVSEPAALGADCSSGGNTDCTGDTPGQYSECGTGDLCACQSGYADGGSGECQPALGSNCGGHGECQAGAGGANSECSTTCVCSSGYTDVSGECKADLGTSCTGGGAGNCADANAECSTTCACASTHYDDNGASNAGGACQIAAAQSTACVAGTANSECAGTAGSETCRCQSTHYDDNGVATAGGACQTGLALGDSCSAVAAAAQSPACVAGTADSECAGTAGSETCQCQSTHYDDNGVSTAGGACQTGLTLTGVCSGVLSAAQNPACAAGVANSECDGTNCVCSSRYTASGTTACKADLGTTCATASDCYDANAACTSTTCVCASTYYDDNGATSDGGTCQMGLALDAACSSVATAAQDAACAARTANSECAGTSGSETCMCKEGFTEKNDQCSSMAQVLPNLLTLVLLAFIALYK